VQISDVHFWEYSLYSGLLFFIKEIVLPKRYPLSKETIPKRPSFNILNAHRNKFKNRRKGMKLSVIK